MLKDPPVSLSVMANEDLNAVKEKSSRAVFRFGDGVECKSLKALTVPVYIGGQQMFMLMDVVESAVPLLISKGAMKQMKMKIDFDRDLALVQGRSVKLYCTESGHY